jgi:chromosome segregation ATPase
VTFGYCADKNICSILAHTYQEGGITMVDEVDVTGLREKLAEAEAQVEALEAAAADAEARASTAQSQVGDLQTQVREAAVRYRAARLAAAPDVPPELVSEAGTIDAVEAEFEAAQRVIAKVRERLEEEAPEMRPARVPAGAPNRRPQDWSSLPASEKIRIGLQQLSEREGR